MPEIKNNKVPWPIFIWVIGIIIVMFGWSFKAMGDMTNNVESQTANVSTKVDKNTTSISEVSGDIKQIKTDINWIREALKKSQ